MKSFVKQHGLYVGLLILLSFWFLAFSFNLTEIPMVDHTTTYLPRAEILLQSFEQGDMFPLWNPFIMGGTPLYAQPIFIGAFSLLGLLLFATGNALASVKLMFFVDIILSGLFMYALGIYLFKRKRVAFFSGILYMMNGFAVRYYLVGALATMNQYPWYPLVTLFFLKSFDAKGLRSRFIHAIICGLLLAVQLRAGPDMKIILWGSLFFAFYALFELFRGNLKKNAIKIASIGFVVLLVFAGLSAQRVFIVKDYLDASSRGDLAYSESASRPVKAADYFFRLVEPVNSGVGFFKFGVGEHIGIIAFLFAGLAAWRLWKKRFVFFLLSTCAVALLAVSGTFVYRIIWTLIPLFHSMRYLERGLILFVFPFILLSGFGFAYWIKRYSGKNATQMFWIVIGLVVVNLTLFNFIPVDQASTAPVGEVISENDILNYLSAQEGHFRMHPIETRGIDWGTEFATIPHNLEMIYGYETAWYPPYFNEYLGLAQQQDPLKLWGVMNVKYVTSTQQISDPSLVFVDEFDRCTACPTHDPLLKANGPYLYENTKFVPRAFITDKAILVVGDHDSAKQTMYGLLLDPRFNASTTAVVFGDTLDAYTVEDLTSYPAILLADPVSDRSKLSSYVDQGGELYPNILEGETQLSEDALNELFVSGNTFVVHDSSYVRDDFDTYELSVPDTEGWLVLSEKFALFDGWDARGSDLYTLERANGVVTALYVEGADTIAFHYAPFSFVIGSWISLLSLFAVAAALFFLYRTDDRSSRKPLKENEGPSSQ